MLMLFVVRELGYLKIKSRNLVSLLKLEKFKKMVFIKYAKLGNAFSINHRVKRDGQGRVIK